MGHFRSLSEAVSDLLHDGDQVAMEGFTHLIPFAAGHEIIRQRKRNLTLIRMTPDLIYDQLIGAGCVRKLIFSWGGNPGVGSLHRFRDAVENGWPGPLEIEEHSHAAMASAYTAGASGLPFAILRGYTGTDLPSYNQTIRFIQCPFTGERLAAVPAVWPPVAIIHAQKSDQRGNVLMWGIGGVQKEAALCARRVVVTVEEIVEDLGMTSNASILPFWTLDAVVKAPGGASASYAMGYYDRDNAFYKRWEEISRTREGFLGWLKEKVFLEQSDSPSLASVHEEEL